MGAKSMRSWCLCQICTLLGLQREPLRLACIDFILFF
uniref:Stabilizer of axonemal microtubules 2 n=1 Tax=Macaca nemestrina TaxID=9545 RepID=A0A2K6CU94_MACNE